MIDYMTKRKHWWVLVDKRGRVVTEGAGGLILSTYVNKSLAEEDAVSLEFADGIDLRAVRITVDVEGW